MHPSISFLASGLVSCACTSAAPIPEHPCKPKLAQQTPKASNPSVLFCRCNLGPTSSLERDGWPWIATTDHGWPLHCLAWPCFATDGHDLKWPAMVSRWIRSIKFGLALFGFGSTPW